MSSDIRHYDSCVAQCPDVAEALEERDTWARAASLLTSTSPFGLVLLLEPEIDPLNMPDDKRVAAAYALAELGDDWLEAVRAK